MEVHFTSEQEAELAQIASKEGSNAEQLVKDAALRLLETVRQGPGGARELPKLHLGLVKSLRRRDIYNDVD